jgi:hypothetical protein
MSRLTEAATNSADGMTADGRQGSLAGQGWVGKVLLSFSVAGLPLVLLLKRQLGRWGGLLVEAGCGVLFVRDVTMAATGVPAKLQPLPRFLLFVEVVSSGMATFAGLGAWVWGPFVRHEAEREAGHDSPAGPGVRGPRPGPAAMPGGLAAGRAATAAAAATFVVHAAREAIYLSPGHGRR